VFVAERMYPACRCWARHGRHLQPEMKHRSIREV
jgi:hypothetical protein